MPKDNSPALPDLDLNDARKFLLTFGRERHFISFIHKDGGPPESVWITAGDEPAKQSAEWAPTLGWAKAAVHIIKMNVEGWNVYFTPNVIRADFAGAKPTKDDIEHVTMLYVDADPADVEGLGYELARATLMKDGQAFARSFPPNTIVDSGNGLQFFWYLTEPLPRSEAEELMKRLHHSAAQHDGINASGTFNSDRIMRLPGTLNWPNSKKLKAGYPDQPGRAKMLAHRPDPTPDLQSMAALPLPEKAMRKHKLQTGSADVGDMDWPPADADKSLQAQHAGWMTDAHYAALIDGSAHDNDKNRCLFGLGRHSVLHGLTIAEFATLVAHAGGAPLGHVENQQSKARAIKRAYGRTDALPVFSPETADNADFAVIELDAELAVAPRPLSGLPSVIRQVDDGSIGDVDAKFESLASSAQGLVGGLTSWGEAGSGRHTHIPALVGALAGVSALSQARWILKSPGYETPLALQLLIVSETGTGKETAGKVAKAAVAMSKGVGSDAEYASAPALHNALVDQPTQLWIDEEFGRFLRSHSSDVQSHSHHLLSLAMRLHTSFFGYLGARKYAKSKDKLPSVPNPMLVTAHQTAPTALRQSFTHDSVEGGGLGRMLVVWPQRRPKQKSLDALEAQDTHRSMPSALLEALAAIEAAVQQANAAQSDMSGNTYTDLGTGRVMWVIAIEDEAKSLLSNLREDLGAQSDAGGVRGALASRAYEQILRVAGVVALGEAAAEVEGDLTEIKCSQQTLKWAADLVFTAPDSLVPEAQEYAADTEAERLQQSILRTALKIPKDAHGWFKRSDLLQRVKGRGRRSEDVRKEIDMLVEAGSLEQRHKAYEGGKQILVVPKQYRLVEVGI